MKAHFSHLTLFYRSLMQLRCLSQALNTVPAFQVSSVSAAPLTRSQFPTAMSVPYSLGPEPEQPPNMASDPTEQLKQGKDSTTATTPLLADSGGDETSEGAPETGMKLPSMHREAASDSGSGPATFSGNPDPQVGHDSRLPAKICPPGYSCNDTN